MRRHEAIRRMRSHLLRRREAIRKSLDLSRSQLQATNEQDVGDSVDVALDAEYHEISSQLAEVESNELTQIDVALDRIATGDYGVCDDCGRHIPLVRLRAVPYVTLCIHCQRGQESLRDQRGGTSLIVETTDRDLLLNGNGANVS
ncbi:MAG: TraR/DksA family transcriptional regulator [Planctomycetes bacterium]|nr:TraR/DksA family transcriptional regulator [Planctomycetota bacterium]